MPDNNQQPTQTDEKKEEQKQPSALERMTEEGYYALKNSINYGLAFTGGALSTYIFGLKAGLSTWGGRVVRSRMANQFRDIPTTSEKVLEESVKATTMVPAIFYGVNFVRGIPKVFRLDDIALNISNYALPISPFVVGAAAVGALTPLLSAFSHLTGYAIENKTFKGIGKYFKENYKKDLIKRLPLSVLGATAIGVTYAYSALVPYLFPFLAATSMFYNALIENGKVMYRRLFYLSTYLPDPINPVRWAEGTGSLYRKLNSVLYSIGDWINDRLKTQPTQPATAASPA